MADNKKYYYMKLKENFFETDEMIILESMPDGYIYSNILLKLYLRSIKNNGKLMFNDKIPYNSQMLANITRHSVGDIERAIKLFQELGIIEIMDSGAIYMSDVQNFIGESSTEADRKRKYRQKIEEEKKNGTNVPPNVPKLSQKCPDKSPPEIEIEKEIDIEKDIEIEKERKVRRHKYGEYHNVLLSDEELEKLKEEFNDYEDRIERLSEYIASSGKKYKSHLATIRAWAKKEKPKEEKKYKYNLGITL